MFEDENTYQKWAIIINFVMIIITAIVASMGLLYQTGGSPIEAANIYGDALLLYGDGIYANDTFFQVGLSKGTDFVMLFITVPLFVLTLLMRKKKCAVIFQFGITTVILYYSASLGFGIAYNSLFLLYLMLFTMSLFAVVLLFVSLKCQLSQEWIIEKNAFKRT